MPCERDGIAITTSYGVCAITVTESFGVLILRIDVLIFETNRIEYFHKRTYSVLKEIYHKICKIKAGNL